ncbi:hypothetical protein SHIRM173S_03255 [Streptomyces hirsutus]
MSTLAVSRMVMVRETPLNRGGLASRVVLRLRCTSPPDSPPVSSMSSPTAPPESTTISLKNSPGLSGTLGILRVPPS